MDAYDALMDVMGNMRAMRRLKPDPVPEKTMAACSARTGP